MPIEGYWYDEAHTIRVIKMTGHWTMTELETSAKEVAPQTVAEAHPDALLYLIVDFSDGHGMPEDPSRLIFFTRDYAHTLEHYNTVFVVAQNHAIRTIVKGIESFQWGSRSKTHFVSVTTIDDALSRIVQ